MTTPEPKAEQKGTLYTVLALVPKSEPEAWMVVGEFRASGKPQARRLAMTNLVGEGYEEATLVATTGAFERETLAVAPTPNLVVKS